MPALRRAPGARSLSAVFDGPRWCLRQMSRQTQVAMTDADERDFLAFLRSTAEIQLFESSAPSPELMTVDQFAPREQGHWQYFIWNRSFAWAPEYQFVGRNAVVRDRVGWSFLGNKSSAPLLEYDRHNFSDARDGVGRVYWAKSFSAPAPLTYDVDAFSKWFDRVVRWIRREGRQLQRGVFEPYLLPDAWAKASIGRRTSG